MLGESWELETHSRLFLYFNLNARTLKTRVLYFFIVVPCILKSIFFTHQQMRYLLNLERFKIYTRIHTNICTAHNTQATPRHAATPPHNL
jgi:hypothetical protein